MVEQPRLRNVKLPGTTFFHKIIADANSIKLISNYDKKMRLLFSDPNSNQYNPVTNKDWFHNGSDLITFYTFPREGRSGFKSCGSAFVESTIGWVITPSTHARGGIRLIDLALPDPPASNIILLDSTEGCKGCSTSVKSL